MKLEQKLNVEIPSTQEHIKNRYDSISRFVDFADSRRLQTRQFGRRRDQQIQLVADANREIADFLANAGFTCRSMCRGNGKRLRCVRITRGSRDE